jgi:hypothetical protein
MLFPMSHYEYIFNTSLLSRVDVNIYSTKEFYKIAHERLGVEQII